MRRLTYTIIETDAVMGRSSTVVQCPCGVRTRRYIWSWAGHGFRRCHGCGSKLMYDGGHVVPSADLERLLAARNPASPESADGVPA